MALQYGPATALTITAGSLVNGASRSSAAVTTSTSINVTAVMLEVSVLTTATSPSGNRQVLLYGYRSLDGINYGGASSICDNVDGTDKTLTAIGFPTNLVFLGTIAMNQAANIVTQRGEFEITSAFACIPPSWGIVLLNDCGTPLGATVTAQYREIYYS